MTPFTILAAATVLALSGGCLPEGEPGLGEPLVSQRGLGGLVFAKGAAAGAGGLLYSHRGLALAPPTGPERQYYGSPPEDLFFLKVGTEPHRLLEKYAGPAQWDARGRLYIGRDLSFRYDPASPRNLATHELWRFDLADLSSLSLGRVSVFEVSPAGTRVARVREDGQGLLRTLDEQELALGPIEGNEVRFVGEDLYFVQAGTLMRLRESGAAAATVVAGDVETFQVLGEGQGHLLIRTGEGASPGRFALVAKAGDTGARILGSGGLLGPPVFAPDGRRLAWMERTGDDRGALRQLDLEAGAETGTELSLPPRPPARYPPPGGPGTPPGVDRPPPEIQVRLEFRPGRDELWCFFPRELRVFGADGSVRAFPMEDQEWRGLGPPTFVKPARFASDYYGGGSFLGSEYAATGGGLSSRFTSDGRFWTFVRDSEGHLGLADQPEAAPILRLFGHDDFDRNVVEVDGGRRVAFWTSEGGGRRALFRADLETRAIQRLARNVGTLRLGRSRALVLARPLSGSIGGPGDLSIVDLATGAETRLAQNVTSFALDAACAGCDAADAGARLVYVVHARVPWKYDGLWSGSLP